MIYVDSSVVLAHLLGEDRSPPDALWREPVMSSRLDTLHLDALYHLAAFKQGVERALPGRVAQVITPRPRTRSLGWIVSPVEQAR